MSGYVVLANRSLGGEALAGHLDSLLASDADARFHVVVPVIAPAFGAFEIGGAMGGIAIVDVEAREMSMRAAEERLGELLRWLQAKGVPAEGAIVSGDPVSAVDEIVRRGDIAEIVLATPHTKVARWLRVDLPGRLRRKSTVPVTVIESGSEELVTETPEAARDVARSAVEQTATAEDGTTTEMARSTSMGESVYKIVELVGTSPESWEKAAAAAVLTASKSLRDLRIAEVAQLDLVVQDGQVAVYRAKVRVSFKYQSE